jgi:GTP cyclohydrolase I
MKVNEKVIEKAWYDIIVKGLNLDIKDPNLTETPQRIAKFYKEFFKKKKYKFTEFPNEMMYSGIVIIRSTGYSVCSHHFLPFSYDCFCGYIPDKKVIGASKIPRVIDFYANRPQIQERMTEQITDFIWKKFKVKGVIVCVYGEHLCMMMRGIQKPKSMITTSSFRGIFEQQTTRDEFFNLIKLWKKD